MLRLAVLLTALAAPVAAQTVPSGQPFALWQIGWERVPGSDGLQLVIRALAPELSSRGYEAVQGDMDWICETHGTAIAQLPYGAAAQIVINLADRPVRRGVTDPEATQFYGIYRLENGSCIWEEL